MTDGDFTSLAGPEEYSRYFRQLQRVFSHLLSVYPAPSKAFGVSQGGVMNRFLDRFLETVKVLETKYTYPPPEARPLFIDVTESGFPNHIELAELQTDAQLKTKRLRELPSGEALRKELVDRLIEHQTDPQAVLMQLSERSYLEAIDEEKMFFPYTAGELVFCGEEGGVRKYSFAFGCFDFATNRPYIHFLNFEQDRAVPALHENEREAENFLAVIRKEGGRAPALAILAMSIDDAIESVHPKLLRRICLGPLYAKVLLENRQSNIADSREGYFQALLESYGRAQDDFIFLLTEELVFSKRQEVTKSMFGQKAREIFATHEADPECHTRRVSSMQHFYLMPHELLQHLDPTKSEGLADFSKAKKLTVDEAGEVHGL